MGVCGCGKSTVAELYAARTVATLIEADGFHPPENVAKMSAGTPLTDEDRAGWLAAMADRLKEGKARGEAMVMTCSALKLAYRDRLREGDPDLFFVFLDGSRELLPPTSVGPADRPREGDHQRDPQGPPARASTLAQLKMERHRLFP